MGICCFLSVGGAEFRTECNTPLKRPSEPPALPQPESETVCASSWSSPLSWQDEAVSPDKGDAAPLTGPASATPAAQEVLYINGNGAYSCHSYGGVGGSLLDLTEAAGSGESTPQHHGNQPAWDGLCTLLDFTPKGLVPMPAYHVKSYDWHTKGSQSGCRNHGDPNVCQLPRLQQPRNLLLGLSCERTSRGFAKRILAGRHRPSEHPKVFLKCQRANFTSPGVKMECDIMRCRNCK